MTSKILADAGAIVGALSERDQHYHQAWTKFAELPKPLYTCEAVITEVMFVLRHVVGGKEKTLGLISDGVLRIDFSLSDEIEAVRSLIEKYESVPMSLADACLVRMSELFDSPIFTFDGDFRIYRRNGRQRIPLLGLEDKAGCSTRVLM